MKVKAKVLDLSTGETKTVVFSNTETMSSRLRRRVLKRAASLYRAAVKMGIKGADLGYYVQYSWRLEKGYCWAKA